MIAILFLHKISVASIFRDFLLNFNFLRKLQRRLHGEFLILKIDAMAFCLHRQQKVNKRRPEENNNNKVFLFKIENIEIRS